jgi:hypothetical protein
MAPHRISLAILVLVASGAAYAGVRAQQRNRPAPSPLDAIPRDAFLVVTVDVASLRSSAFASLLGGGALAHRLPGVDSVATACGFDPMTRVKQLAFALPEASEHGDFGVVAIGDFKRKELETCAVKTIESRGGQARVGSHGSFTTIEEDNAQALDSPRLAYSDNGVFLVGRGAWLTAMIDTVEGRDASIRSSAAHESLRSALETGDPMHPRSAVMTAILPGVVRAKLRTEIGLEVVTPTDMTTTSTMNGVLSVAVAGIALSAGPPGGQTEIVADLRCDTPDGCAAVARILETKRKALGQDFRLRLLGLGPVLESMTVQVDGSRVKAVLRIPSDDAVRLLDRVLSLRGGGGGSALRPGMPASSPPPRLPDEIVAPPRDAGPPSPHPSYK